VSEGSLGAFAPQSLQLLPLRPARPPAVGIDGGLLLGRLVGPDARVLQLRLGNVGAIGRVLAKFRQRAIGMIALIGCGLHDARLCTPGASCRLSSW
jgi:hypothetical protein